MRTTSLPMLAAIAVAVLGAGTVLGQSPPNPPGKDQTRPPTDEFRAILKEIEEAYKAPREVNYWFGLGLLMLTLAISVTGYLLPWDQRGYWSTKVVTNLISGVPRIGDSLQRLVVGDANYGHHTLTRFFAMHAGILPALMVLLILGHVALFRNHGLTAKLPKKSRDAMF